MIHELAPRTKATTLETGPAFASRSFIAGQPDRVFCRYESGNSMKDLLGQGSLKWDENKKQGAYAGQKVRTDISLVLALKKFFCSSVARRCHVGLSSPS